MIVPDLAANAETQGSSGPHKLRTLTILAGMMLLIYLPSLAGRLFFTQNGQVTNDVMVSIIIPTICGILMVAIPVFMIRRAPRYTAFDCTALRWRWSELAWFCVLSLAVVVSAIPIGIIQQRTGLPIEWAIGSQHGFYESKWLFVWTTIYGILLGPIAEEFFWRGYMQSSLMRVSHPIMAIVIQSVFFGLVHYKPVLGTAVTITHGLVCGVWCWRRRTLVPVMIIHIVGNGIAFSYRWADWRELAVIKPVHDYVAEFVELSRPVGYGPNDDARQEYDRAFQLVVALPKRVEDMRQRYPTLWSDEEKTRVEAWLTSNAKALNLVEEGSRKPYYWPEYEFSHERILTFLLVHPKEMRCIISALSMRASVIAAQDQHEKALNDIATSYRVGCHLLQCKDTISQLMGMAVYGLASQTAREILSHEDINPELLTDLQWQLESLEWQQPVRFDLRAERLFLLDVIQHLFTDDGRGGGHIPRCAFDSLRVPRGGLDDTIFDLAKVVGSDISEWGRLDRRQTTQDVWEYYRAFEKATAMAPWDYEKNARELKRTISRISRRDLLIKVLTINPRLIHMSAKARADLDSVITILAILRYKADRQEFPESLAQLVTEGYLMEIPRDPFSDGALVYNRIDGDFVLYSFGADFDDDGGTPSKWGEGKDGGDQVFWPVRDQN